MTFPNGEVYAGYWEAGKLDGKYLCKKKGVWSEKKVGFMKNGKGETSVESQKVEILKFLLKKLLFLENIAWVLSDEKGDNWKDP